MGCEPDSSIGVVVDAVIVHVEGQAHNDEGRLARAKEKQADGSVLGCTCIYHVVGGLHCDPFVVEKEMDGWEVVVTLAEHVALLHVKLSLAYCFEKKTQEMFEIEGWEYDC